MRRDWDIVAVTAGDERRTVDADTEAVPRFDGEGAVSTASRSRRSRARVAIDAAGDELGRGRVVPAG